MSAVSKYINVFGGKATEQDLEHIFDVLNENNDDRIQFREFVKHIENVGLKVPKDNIRKIFDHIASLGVDKVITKATWVKGITIAHQNPLTHKAYLHILRGGQYDPQSGRSEIDLDEIQKCIKDTKAEWRHRMKCMESLARQITEKKLTVDKFHSLFRSYHVGLTKQARDRRSNVMRVACECLSKIIRRWGKEYSRYGCVTIEYIYELVRQKISVVHEMGFNVLATLFKNCPDRSKLKFMDMLGREGTTSKFQNLKKDCFDLLLIYFLNQNDNLKDDDNFWKQLMIYTKKGVNDVDQIRNSALHLLAAIQVERHDLAFPIIKQMNDHLRKRYESDFKLSNKNASKSSKKNKKKNKNTPGNNVWGSNDNDDNHVRKHTWSTNDLIIGFNKMKVKQSESKKKKKKIKTKVKPKFPQAPAGQFFSAFGESLISSDVLYAFQFIDYKNDHRITFDEFQQLCEKLDIKGNQQKLFGYLDVNNNDYIDFNDFKLALSKKKDKLMDFWYRILSGRALEEAPKLSDFGMDESQSILGDMSNDINTRILALHSITRKCCMKLSVDKFHKIFKKFTTSIIAHLYSKKALIVRETCICLAKIIIARRAQFVKFSCRVLESLYDIIKLNDNCMHTSSHQCAKTLVRFVPDTKKFQIFQLITRGCTNKKFLLNRQSSFIYCNHVLARMVQVDQHRNDRFYKLVIQILTSGLQDSNQVVRDAAYSLLAKVDLLRPDIAVQYVKQLRKTAKDKYEKVKKNVYNNVQKEDFKFEGPGLMVTLGHSSSNTSNNVSNDWGQVFDLKLNALDQSSGSKSNKKLNKSITSPRLFKDKSPSASPKINTDSTFTLTQQDLAKLAKEYRIKNDAFDDDNSSNVSSGSSKNGKKNKKHKKNTSNSSNGSYQNRKNTHGAPVNKKKFKSQNPLKRRSNTVHNVVDANKKNKSKRRNAKSQKQKSATTDDYPSTGTKRRGRGSLGGNNRKRPNTARVSLSNSGSDKNKKKKNKNVNSNSLRQAKNGKNKKNSTKKKKSNKKFNKIDKEIAKLSLQEQAAQALCVCRHKLFVEVFIQKTQELQGTIFFKQFKNCLNSLNLDVSKDDALTAYQVFDPDEDYGLNMEEFVHAVHFAYPEYELLWKQLGKGKYRHYSTKETLLSIEEIKAILVDKKSKWRDKTKALRIACSIIADPKKKEIDVTIMIKKMIDSIIVSLRSHNSIIVREACLCIATISKSKSTCLKGVVGKLLKTCWELLDDKIELIKFSAGECLKIVIKYVPDDSDNKYLKTLIQGTKLNDFASVRQSCYECIIVMILRAGNPKNQMGNDFWKRIKQIVIDGVKSSEIEVKDYAFHCLYAFEKASPQKAQRVLELLDGNIVKEYHKAVFADDGMNNDNSSTASSVDHSPEPSPSVASTISNISTGSTPTPPPQQQPGAQPPGAQPLLNNQQPPQPGVAANSPKQSLEQSVTTTAPAPGVTANSPIDIIKQKEKTSPKAIMTSKDDNKNDDNQNDISKVLSPLSTKFKIKTKHNVSPTTPVPSNNSLSRSYEERTQEIEDIFNQIDDKSEGYIVRFKAIKFLKDVMNVNMRNAEIILTGLDPSSHGKFTKDMLFKWVYIHSPEMEPNTILHKNAEQLGWLTLRKNGLEKRKSLYQQLYQMEKTDKNYNIVYDLDQKICILNYLLTKC